MTLKYLLLFVFINAIDSKLSISVTTGATSSDVPQIQYSGIDVKINITKKDLEVFQINRKALNDAVKTYYGRKPTGVRVNNATDLCNCDLYNTYRWEPVTRVLSIKSARVKNVNKENKILKFENLINNSTSTTKLHSDISYTAENSLKTGWTNEKELTVSQDIEYDMVIATGQTSISYTSKWGQSEEKVQTETIGSTSGVELELKPGQAVKVELSANAGFLDIEVVYKARLRGNLAVNFKRPYKGHHFWGPPIENVMERAGLSNEILTFQTITYSFYVNGSVKVTNIEIPIE